MLFTPLDYTTVFLSYDEPNCEENYQHLLTLNPNALRVHGVKGSDTAHKQVASISVTENVIVIDGDNYVKPDFFTNIVELPESYDPKTNVLSFSAYNPLNGNSYGNGGIKVWPVSLLQSMQTHENGDDKSIDFDFSTYIQVNVVASETRINASPLQAWRAGFREGIKLTQDKDINWRNYDRLWRWMHLGLDMTNGVYAIHGARSSFYLSRTKQFENLVGVRDFDVLDKMFELAKIDDKEALAESNQLGVAINMMIDSHTTLVLSAHDSKKYKDTIAPILRCDDKRPYDIVYLGKKCDNYQKLTNRFPNTKLVDVKRKLVDSYKNAAKQCTTDYFWVVEGDSENFDFDFQAPFFEKPKVRVWGNIKLVPRMNVIRMNEKAKNINDGISDIVENYVV